MSALNAALAADRIESLLGVSGLIAISNKLPTGSYAVETSIAVTALENESIEITRPFKTVFWVQQDYPIVRVVVFLTDPVPDERRDAMCQLLARINNELAVGAFAMSPDEGYVFYYNAMVAHDDEEPPVDDVLGTCRRVVAGSVAELEELAYRNG